VDIPFDVERLRAHVREVADFPDPGVGFKDITPLLAAPELFSSVIDALVVRFGRGTIDAVVGIESRGFILGAPVADRLGAAFVPARKAGKLPGPTRAASYDLEYGQAVLEIHQDAFPPGARVLIIDDVLATGGTAAACSELVEAMGGTLVGLGFLIAIDALGGAERLQGRDHLVLMRY
jgi:adenine phosphoribosyltransferase